MSEILASYRTLGYLLGLCLYMVWLFACISGVYSSRLVAIPAAVLGLTIMRKFSYAIRPRHRHQPQTSSSRWLPPQLYEGLLVFFPPWLALASIFGSTDVTFVVSIVFVIISKVYVSRRLASASKARDF